MRVDEFSEQKCGKHGNSGHHWMKKFHRGHHGGHHQAPPHHGLFRHHGHGFHHGKHRHGLDHHGHHHDHHHKHGHHKHHRGLPKPWHRHGDYWKRIHFMFFSSVIENNTQNQPRATQPVREETPVADIQNCLSRLQLALPAPGDAEEAGPAGASSE